MSVLLLKDITVNYSVAVCYIVTQQLYTLNNKNIAGSFAHDILNTQSTYVA